MTHQEIHQKSGSSSTLYPSGSPGVTESFLRRPHSSRDFLGECLSGSSFPEKAKKRLMQSVGVQFPSRALLHQWGKEDFPNCPFCHEREFLGHIQSSCRVLEKPRIVAQAPHNIAGDSPPTSTHSGDEGDEHKWAILSAISVEQHKEITVRQILHSLGLFPTDEALESKILEFFAQRTVSALSYASHFTDDTDPTLLVLEPDSQADPLVRLRFSTSTLNENKIRPLTYQELQITVSAFLDLRPDVYAIHQKSKRLAILEFTRDMDSAEDWEEKKDAEKRSRYAPVFEFFNSLRERQGRFR
jgi:hypothetical protein